MRIIEDETGKFFIEDGIVHCIFPKNNAIVDLEWMKKGIRNRIGISEGQSRPVLVFAHGVKYWSLEAKKYSMTEKEAKLFISSLAMVVDSLALRISVNWAITFFPSGIPMKAFSDKNKALAWLKTQK
jgi:hypothetical protein